MVDRKGREQRCEAPGLSEDDALPAPCREVDADVGPAKRGRAVAREEARVVLGELARRGSREGAVMGAAK